MDYRGHLVNRKAPDQAFGGRQRKPLQLTGFFVGDYNESHRRHGVPLFNNPLPVSVHVTDALWAGVNDAYVKASCIGRSAASVPPIPK